MNSRAAEVKKERVHIFDGLRGLALLIMIAHHTLFDMFFIFGFKASEAAFTAVNSFVWIAQYLFVIISGACVVFGSSPEKRGTQLFVIGVLITFFTMVFMPSQLIICDVLCLLGFCMMVYSIVKKVILKIPALVAVPVFLLLFAVTYNIGKGYLGFNNFLRININPEFYTSDALCFFGFHTMTFFSANYWPVFPMIFLFFASVYLGKAAKDKKLAGVCYKRLCPPLEFFGRHSLAVYILHQPLIYGILLLIFNFSM